MPFFILSLVSSENSRRAFAICSVQIQNKPSLGLIIGGPIRDVVIVCGDLQIHYCWDTIDGGFLRSALEDLTGGYAFTLDFAKKDKKVHTS